MSRTPRRTEIFGSRPFTISSLRSRNTFSSCTHDSRQLQTIFHYFLASFNLFYFLFAFVMGHSENLLRINVPSQSQGFKSIIKINKKHNGVKSHIMLGCSTQVTRKFMSFNSFSPPTPPTPLLFLVIMKEAHLQTTVPNFEKIISSVVDPDPH
jgi:hypothetical protein